MSAFGVVAIGVGVLMIWAGIKHQKLNVVLQSFYAKPAAAGGAPSAVPGSLTAPSPQPVVVVS